MNGGFTFLAPAFLFLIWLPLALLPVLLIRERGYMKKISGLFASEQLDSRRRSRAWAIVLMLIGITWVIAALSRPAWGYSEVASKKTGRDIVFLIDVSRSMLAEDLYPNRLERAKLAIQDAMETVDGDRVALVAFAGTAVVKCPLTLDYPFFLNALRSLKPGSVSRGGSLIGDALRKTSRDVLKGTGGYQDIILITDGGDQESLPVEAAKELAEKEVRIIAIGLGDENTGVRIPVTGANGSKSFLTYNGQEVWTKLDADILKKTAQATPGGQYLNVATGNFNLDEIYAGLIRRQESRVIEESKSSRLIERYRIFLAAGLAFIFASLLFSAGGKRRARP